MIDTPSCHFKKIINTPEYFWTLTDNIQNKALSYCDNLFSSLREASLTEFQNVLIQYCHFTTCYISDLALLITRLEKEVMKSFLS